MEKSRLLSYSAMLFCRTISLLSYYLHKNLWYFILSHDDLNHLPLDHWSLAALDQSSSSDGMDLNLVGAQ